jgi:hypothetical protein
LAYEDPEEDPKVDINTTFTSAICKSIPQIYRYTNIHDCCVLITEVHCSILEEVGCNLHGSQQFMVV